MLHINYLLDMEYILFDDKNNIHFFYIFILYLFGFLLGVLENLSNYLFKTSGRVKNEINNVNENVDNQPVDNHQINEQAQVINVARNNDNNQVTTINNKGQSDINTNNQYIKNNQNNYTNNLPEYPITNRDDNNDIQKDININFSNQQRNNNNDNNYFNVKRDDQEEKIDSERGEILDIKKPKNPSNNINNYKDYEGETKKIYINNTNINIDNINDRSNMDNNNQGLNNNENNDNEKPAPNLGEIENHYEMGNEEEENKNQKIKEERPKESIFNNYSQSEDKFYDDII